jgi:hypothetical protein
MGCDRPHRVLFALNGETLEALYWDPAKGLSPGVLLVAPAGQEKESWVALGTRLRTQGYGVLALELSADGSGGEELPRAFEYMRLRRKVDAARIGIVGAEAGANAALEFAAREPLVRMVVMLSPGEKTTGQETVAPLRDYGFRPLLLVEANAGTVGAVDRLAEAAGGRATVIRTRNPQASQDELVAFLARHL